MTPEEVSTLAQQASIEHVNTVRTIVLLVCYGVFFLLFLESSVLVLPCIPTSVPARATLGLLLLLFISLTMHFGAGIHTQLTMLTWPIRGTPASEIQEKIMLSRMAIHTANSVFITAGRVALALIDVVVVSRAYVLWCGSTFVRATLAASLFISVFFALALTGWEAYNADRGLFDPLTSKLNVVSLFLNFAVNALATAFIALRVWRYRELQPPNHTNTQNSTVKRAAHFIVEAGMLLAAFQFVWAVLAARSVAGEVSDPVFITTVVFSEIMISLSGIYTCVTTKMLWHRKLHAQSPSLEGKSRLYPAQEHDESREAVTSAE